MGKSLFLVVKIVFMFAVIYCLAWFAPALPVLGLFLFLVVWLTAGLWPRKKGVLQ